MGIVQQIQDLTKQQIQEVMRLNKYQKFRNTFYREKTPSSPRYSFNKNGDSRSSRTFYIPWAGQGFQDTQAVWQAAKDFLGYPEKKIDNDGDPYLSRIIPHTNPNFNNFYWADTIGDMDGTIPLGKDNNDVGKFTEAVMVVNYTTPLYNIMDDATLAVKSGKGDVDESSLLRYVTVDFQAAGKYQTIPSFTALYWDNGGTGIDQNGRTGPITALDPRTKRNPTIVGPVNNFGNIEQLPVANANAVFLSEGDLTIEWHEIPASLVPWNTITSFEGCTNLFQLGHPDSLVGTCLRPGTLVMLSPKRKLIRLVTGESGYNIAYKFKYYPNGANSFFNIDRGVNGSPNPGFQSASTKSGTPLYQGKNFDRLFQLEIP